MYYYYYYYKTLSFKLIFQQVLRKAIQDLCYALPKLQIVQLPATEPSFLLQPIQQLSRFLDHSLSI
jgi:hypothetical protein